MAGRVGRRAFVGLALVVLGGGLALHIAAQGTPPALIITDLVGQQGPADPLPPSWTLNPPFAISPSSLFRRANGRIHVTARTQNLNLDLPSNYASQPNTSVTRLNPYAGPQEILEPLVAVEGACWERAGTCDYVVDAATCSVVERDHATGALQRITGSTCQSSTPDGRPRLDARYPFLTAIGYQPSQGLLFGTCWFSSSAIYRIVPGVNVVERVAGTGTPGYDLDNVPATTARIDCPRGVIDTAYVPGNPGATDGYVFAEFNNNIVRRVNAGGILSTVAGDRSATGPGNGDGGPATSARLVSPTCVTPYAGHYYICEGDSVRDVDVTTGTITTEITSPDVTSPWGVAADNGGNLFVGDLSGARVGVLPAGGGSYQLAMGTPLGAPPNLYFNGDGRPANEVSLGPVSDVAFLPDDGTGLRLVIADPFDHRVRLWDEDTGLVTTLAGSGVAGYSGDGGPAAAARLNEPLGVAASDDGKVYIAEKTGCRIREVDTAGNISTVAGTGVCLANIADNGPGPTVSLAQPSDVEIAGNILYWTEIGVTGHLVRRMPLGGNVQHLAGTGLPGYSGDGGPAASAALSTPRGLGLAPGAVYVADTNNHRVRRIDLAEHSAQTENHPINIETPVGTGVPGFSGDRGPAGSAQVNFPTEVYVYSPTQIFVGDQGNNRIREVSLNHPVPQIDTAAGIGGRGRGPRGGSALAAKFDGAGGLGVITKSGGARFVALAEKAGRVSLLEESLGAGPPGAPPDVNAAVDGNRVDIDWGPASGSPTGYTLNAYSSIGGRRVASLQVGLSLHWTGSAPNDTYFVTVQASNANGTGPESSPVTVTVPGALSPPPAPQITHTVTDRTVSFAIVGEYTPTPGLIHIVAALEPGGPPIAEVPLPGFRFDPTSLARPSALVRSFSFTDVPPGVYFVRVHFGNRAGLGPPSNEVEVRVAVPPAPGAPVLAPAQVNGSAVTLSWTPSATGGAATSYVVVASLTPSGAVIASLPVGSASLQVNAPPGTYYVRVRAVGPGGTSAASNEIQVTVL